MAPQTAIEEMSKLKTKIHNNLTCVANCLPMQAFVFLVFHEHVVDEVDEHIHHEEVEEEVGSSHIFKRRLHAKEDAQRNVDDACHGDKDQQWPGLFAFALSCQSVLGLVKE